MKCNNCDKNGVQRGWDNAMYCSESCERAGVSKLHGSMPGCSGKRWLPAHISREIENSWAGDRG